MSPGDNRPDQDQDQDEEPSQDQEAGQGGRRSFRRSAGTAALVLAALVAGRVVTMPFGVEDTIDDPFLRSGTVGQAVSLRYADVTATTVNGSSCVLSPLGSPAALRTPGVFVVVPLTLMAKGEPRQLRYAALIDRTGRTFEATGARSMLLNSEGQPGVARYASVVVEIPPDAVAGAHLRVALNNYDQRRDDMADIDLRVTAATAAEWSRNTTQLKVHDSSDQPPAAEDVPNICPGPA